ncbi:MAG TPA: GNAT family N-acetyltransferase, partial [Actinomycetota bacterium]|nr:GNAT family N-acetyltransferase [Actinomycetota bacterium]
MTDELDLLRRLDAYLDAAPRTAARPETIGPFTLFVNEGTGWRYYARPTPGADAFAPADVETVRARQRALAMPESFEWIADLVPGLADAVRAAGMAISEHPAMVLRSETFRPVPAPDGVAVGAAAPFGDLAVVQAVAMVSFGAPGTGRGLAAEE